MNPSIAIIDYGGQYVQNIRRAFREMSIPAEILPPDVKAQGLDGVDGLVLSGGPYSVYMDSAPTLHREVLESGRPVLGLCYGHQLLAHLLGGRVSGGKAGEYGFAELEIDGDNPLFRGISGPQIVCMSHGDEVSRVPEGFVPLASTRDCPNAAMAHRTLPIYGLQFHPEVSHTPMGWKLLENFAREICGLEVGSWDPDAYIAEKVQWIRNEVGDGTALVAVSGGVDSTVVAALAVRALGDRLVSVHVDHGFMRKNESARVVEELRAIGLDPVLVDASREFFRSLEGITSGDAKRRAVGSLFIRTFEEVAGEKSVSCLVQGTIAPDAIESSRGIAAEGRGSEHGGMIKLHHNVGGLPQDMWIRVLEPIRDLFKYQVRILGKALGVPEGLLMRQPYPGPGLSVRVAGEATPEKVEIIRDVTLEVEDFLERYQPSQYLVYLTDLEMEVAPVAVDVAREQLGDDYLIEAWTHGSVAVGVKGDERLLGRMLSLDITRDGKPTWKDIRWLDLLRLQSAITGRLRDVCRVAAHVGSSEEGDLGAVVRAVDTRDFMTAMPTKVPFEELHDLGKAIVRRPRIREAYYEITTKPSSTIELE